MTQRNKILCAIFVLTVMAALVAFLLGKSPKLLLFMGGIVFFMTFVLWETPRKHKSFSYRDQQRAFRAFDRSDLLDFMLPNRKRKRKDK
jgi:hypothetical protein